METCISSRSAVISGGRCWGQYGHEIWAGGPDNLIYLFFWPIRARTEYYFSNLIRSSMERVPHTSVLRVGSWGGGVPAGLKRYYGHGDLHFLTFSCYQRLPLLGTVRARNVFVGTLGKIRERYGFLLVGYVVTPEHVHLLISEPSHATPSIVLKVLKQRVSRELREGHRCARADLLRLPFTGNSEGLERFWQPRFYDFNVYSAKKKREKLEYMHSNPVTRGLVEHPKDWPWSSFSFYARGEMGLVPVDLVG